VQLTTPTPAVDLTDPTIEILEVDDVSEGGELGEEKDELLTQAMLDEEKALEAAREAEDEDWEEEQRSQLEKKERSDGKSKSQLDDLLQKASAYSEFLTVNMPTKEVEVTEEEDLNAGSAKKRVKGGRGGAAKKAKKGDSAVAMQNAAKAMIDSSSTFKQPARLQGGSLKDYQLLGVQWLSKLFENGLNGILADEMGLGKTIQVLGLIAHIREQGANGPVLIVGPLSVTPNWEREIAKWLPGMPVQLYHGSVDERASLRRSCMSKSKENDPAKFPLVVTSYEIVMRDRKHLCKYDWLYIVVDEGHRLKNLNCRLIRELKSYRSANRLLLSGTAPLQNNLQELWSLLNFVLPDIFNDLSAFEGWFDLEAISTGETSELVRKQHQDGMVTKLHHVLRPFLLRRLKVDVLPDMPDKKEVIVYAGLTDMQIEYAKLVRTGGLAALLKERLGADFDSRVANQSMQNKLMQLRKVCNHPFLFDWPLDEYGNEIREECLVTVCGKMQVLDRMLRKLHAQKRKVLIFSQMTRVLDVIEEYLALRDWRSCRIDGTTNFRERQAQMDEFNTTPEIFVFMLSTRAGGLGINLTAADTVILYDSDWNPHQDAQAMDRSHRIGQTEDVLVYRLIVEGSVENLMMQKANAKRKLERLVITRGNFQNRAQSVSSKTKAQATADYGSIEKSELEAILQDDVSIRGSNNTGDKKTLGIDDEELDMIMDRKRMFLAPAPDEEMAAGSPGGGKGKSPAAKGSPRGKSSPRGKAKAAAASAIIVSKGKGYEIVETAAACLTGFA
jgi:ATP-dependent DNA helicase